MRCLRLPRGPATFIYEREREKRALRLLAVYVHPPKSTRLGGGFDVTVPPPPPLALRRKGEKDITGTATRLLPSSLKRIVIRRMLS